MAIFLLLQVVLPLRVILGEGEGNVPGITILAASIAYIHNCLLSLRDGRAVAFCVCRGRKVRTPQGRMPANGRAP